ncbi:MAG TPA: hypothetical protein QGF95_15490 [Candidatus Latescibacteria bacterium]|nr:hypothetical protein [Candidatus Latescibacterota bacterium]
MLTLKEVRRNGHSALVRVEGYLTWSTARVLREACDLYGREGINHVGLVVDQLRGVDLPAIQVLQGIEAGGMEIRFHEAGGFVRAALTSQGLTSWLSEPGVDPV